MEKITILAKSSGRPEPYSVEFNFKDGKLSVFCNCPAGRNRILCKHKWQMIKGNDNILYDDDSEKKLNKNVDWVQKSEYLDLIIDLSKAEKEKVEIDKRLKLIKKKIADGMKTGLSQF